MEKGVRFKMTNVLAFVAVGQLGIKLAHASQKLGQISIIC